MKYNGMIRKDRYFRCPGCLKKAKIIASYYVDATYYRCNECDHRWEILYPQKGGAEDERPDTPRD